MQSVGKQLFLNLTLDSPDANHFEIPMAGLKAFWIIEDINQLVPVCSFIYDEQFSELSEVFNLIGNETLTVDLGLNRDKYRTFKFKYFSYEARSKGVLLVRNKIVTSNWIGSDFINLRQYPQVFYYPQTTASEVAQNIANVPIEIEASKGSCDYFLNNMVVGEALKSLALESYNAEGSSFLFYKNVDKFKFHSRNAIMRQSTKSSYAYGYNMSNFVIYGNDRSLFTNPESTVIGYSYENGADFEYSKDPATVKSIKSSFGKSMPFGNGIDISPKSTYEGTRHIHEAEAKATRATEAYMDSAFRMSFVGLGQPFLSCGDVIEIAIGASFPSLGKYNMTISGKWFVEKIVHHVAKFNYSCKIFISKANADFSRRQAVL